MCNDFDYVCTRSVSYDLQAGIHLHKAATKGRDGGPWGALAVLTVHVLSCV